jgi:arylsulfatase A
VFDSHGKLYGDGTFVGLDPAHGGEQQVQPKPGSTGARRLAEFRKIMINMNDGPLSEDRFPMCIGKPSLDPKVPAIRAECPNLREAAGAD